MEKGASPAQESVPFERGVIAFLFVLPVAWFVWPVLPHFRDAILGLADDNVLNLWTFWHVTNALLLRDEPLYSTMRVLAPLGSTLALHDMCILPSLLLAPLTGVLGTYAGFNLLLVMAQLWAGFGAYMLVRHLTGSRLSAAFAAFLLEMSPILYYRQINHYSLTYIGFIPFLIYLLLKGADAADLMPARRRGLLTGLAAIACFLTSFNIFILSFFTLGAMWLALLVEALASKAFASAKRLAMVAAWTGLACTIFFFAWTVVTPVQDARYWWDEPTGRVGNEHGALEAYLVVPNPHYWLFASHFSSWPRVGGGDSNDERFNDLGCTSLALFVIGMFSLARRRRGVALVLLLTAIACFDLSLGYGSINPMSALDADKRASAWLLFPKFLSLPLMKQARVPARWSFPLLACVVAGAGCGVHWLMEKIHGPKRRLAVLAALCAMAFVEYAHSTTPTTTFAMPDAYRAMGTADAPTALIIETPIYEFCGLKGWFGARLDPARMAWAMQHRYRIVTAYLSRISYRRIAAVLNQPLIRDLWMLQGGSTKFLTDTAPTDMMSIRRWIAVNDARFIVINKKMDYKPTLEYLKTTHLASPIKEDAQYIVLKIER
jgi:hypothetical protein